jgi:hypothetical protein
MSDYSIIWEGFASVKRKEVAVDAVQGLADPREACMPHGDSPKG